MLWKGEPMSRLIDADALFREMEKAQWYNNADRDEIAEELVLNAPTIEKRKTGHWIPQDHNHTHGNVSTLIYFPPVCSECGHAGDFNMNFCPNCGADMREEGE